MLQAVESALNQTLPVRGIVVENCGPDPTLRDMVLARFGSRITYYRNSHNRGMFDNWNACIEYCTTPWLSILHDDDFLEPCFVEAMVEAAVLSPGCTLYFVECHRVDEHGACWLKVPQPAQANVEQIDPSYAAYWNPLLFTGQLFLKQAAQSAGGFRPASRYCGDWEMWFKLMLDGGAGKTNRVVGNRRDHPEVERGTNKVVRDGTQHGWENVQRKRNLALLSRRKGVSVRFDRKGQVLAHSPVPARLLFANAYRFSKRYLNYNSALFLNSAAPNTPYRIVQMLVKIGGPNSVRIISHLSRAWRKDL